MRVYAQDTDTGKVRGAGYVFAHQYAGGLTKPHTKWSVDAEHLQDGTSIMELTMQGTLKNYIYAPTVQGQVIQAAPAQQADLVEWNDSTGAKLSAVDPHGAILLFGSNNATGTPVIRIDPNNQTQLQVTGDVRFDGQVKMTQPQGDILMGEFGN